MRNLIAAHVLLIAVNASSYAAPSLHERVDLGGNLETYMANVDQLNREKRAKRISGICASACTIYLGVRNVCIDLSAELWFHAAYHPSNRQLDPAATLRMLSYYPPAVRRWAMASGALEQTEWSARHMLTGRDLIRMGMRPCRRGALLPWKRWG